MKLRLTNFDYQLDATTNVWLRPGYDGIAYSDGDETEQRIAEIIAQADDITVLSTELRQHCIDWPSLYHLSGTRANILRPFEGSLKDANVLEIGAGCGAITRYLGECGAKVLALEGTPRRAAIARSRTRDLANVEVVSDRFSDFNWDQQFDVVTLIGVLEYANLFTEGENPALAMLERVRSLLKPDGKLIIAIENQLGLKYFAGAPEDHIGQPMYGIEGRYQKNQPETFGHKVLADILRQAGFASSEFLAPFPDYKLPLSILTEAGINNKNFDAAAFAWQTARRDPQLPPYCNFSPELAWDEIFNNGLGLDLANSFLIVASPSIETSTDKNTLAYHFSTDRAPRYCKETVFCCDDENRVTVKYRPLGTHVASHANNELIHAVWPAAAPYVKGKPLSWEFIQIVSRDGWAIEEVAAFIMRYVALIGDIARKDDVVISPSLQQSRLPGSFFDLSPQNIIIGIDGEAVAIDQEWKLGEEIELGRILFRSLLLMISAVTRFGKNSEGRQFSRGGFVKAALESAGYRNAEVDFSRFIEQESLIQQQVTGRSASEFLQWWPDQPLPTHSLHQVVVEREGQIASLNQVMAERDALIVKLNQVMAERDTQIANLNQVMAERDAQIANLNQVMAERDTQIANLNQAVAERDGQITALYNSTSWRLMQPLRVVMHQMKRGRRVAELALPAIERGGGLKTTCKKAISLYRHEGMAGIKRGFRMVATAGQIAPSHGSDTYDRNDYAEWIRRYDTVTDDSRTAMSMRITTFSQRPLISVVMPTYNPKPEWLIDAIESVRKQIYPHWELCIADDASTDKTIRTILERYSKGEPRIKVTFREKNGHISASSNTALQLATGDWVALLDHDDLLTEHALYWVADAINHRPDVQLIYSDEDKINEAGSRFDPYFKCDWNPDLFYSHNLISHLGTYRADLLRDIGGFREGLEGSQDHDLALRCIERIQPDQIHHIPRVLYHWRMHSESTAQSADAKPYALLAGERALNEYFQRLKIKATVKHTGIGYRVRYDLPDSLPLVSLIIPTRNGLQLIRTCVESILEKTAYPNYEILIIDNGSDDPGTLQYFKSLEAEARVRIVRDDRPFNYSALNNGAAKLARGEVLGLLNNDLEVISPDWLSEMVSHAMRPEVGAVGARLYYPNDTIQHAGVILGMGGVAGHAHKDIPRNMHGYFGRAGIIQSLSAVTAACLLVRKEIYEEVGGLNEMELQVAFNDVDFCLRVREAGYRNVWTPYAELYHHESATRGYEDTPEKLARFKKEIRYMEETWGMLFQHDPAYNPNLTLDHTDFSLAWPPRTDADHLISKPRQIGSTLYTE